MQEKGAKRRCKPNVGTHRYQIILGYCVDHEQSKSQAYMQGERDSSTI